MRKRLSTSAFVMIALFMPLAGGQAIAQTPGEQMFQRRCGVCHSAKQGEIKTGPSLWGVVGRKAGTDPAFRYSSGLKDFLNVLESQRQLFEADGRRRRQWRRRPWATRWHPWSRWSRQWAAWAPVPVVPAVPLGS